MSEEDVISVGVEDVLRAVVEGAAAHAAATEAFIENLEFYGRSLKEHSDALAINIPPDVTPEVLRELFVKLARNIQISSHYLSVASSISGALTGGSNVKKSDLISAIVSSYSKTNAKRPAAAVLEHMADSYMSNTAGAQVASKIIKDFWRCRLDALLEVRKCLEQVSISHSVELKHSGD